MQTHHIGSYLMHTFGCEGLSLVDIEELGVKDGQAVCFCFGEIDCRCHVHNYVDEGTRNVIDRLADGYFDAIKENVKRYSNLRVLVFNVVPPQHYTAPSRKFWAGSDDDRQRYVLMMNDAIAARCNHFDYLFVDIYDASAGPDGFIDDDQSDKRMHIIEATNLAIFLYDHLLLPGNAERAYL